MTAPRPLPGDSPLHFGDNRPPQGLGYLSSYVSQFGHEVEIIDLYAFGGKPLDNNPGVNQEEIGNQLDINLIHQINSFKPDYLGMYVHSISYFLACKLSNELKIAFPGIPQICGGPHPTVMPESMPDTFDYIVSGEGEYALLDILEGGCQNRFIHGSPLTSENLENLPWPDFDQFWGKPYNWKLKLFQSDISPVLTISTSRGCPFLCRFCAVKSIYPHYEEISAELIFARMNSLADKYEVNTFYFREDNFTVNTNRLNKFCDLIIDSGNNFKWVCESRTKELNAAMIAKMAQAGCIGLYIGCESGSQKVLDTMGKNTSPGDFIEKFKILQECGIYTYTTWIFGSPNETSEDRALTEDLINRLNPDSVDRFVYVGIPKSQFYVHILNEGKYEFLDTNGFIYPAGYFSLSEYLYGQDDPRFQYVQKIYSRNSVSPIDVTW